MLKSIRNFFVTECPALNERKIDLNCLGRELGSIAIRAVPCSEVIREYADGGSLKQFVFDLCTRASFDCDDKANSEADSFMQEIKGWILNADAGKIQMPEGEIPLNLEIAKTYGVAHSDRSGAEYSLRARLIYEN